MSDVASSAKAKLVLDELEQRTRLMKLVRGERGSWSWWPEALSLVLSVGLLVYWLMAGPSTDELTVLVFICLVGGARGYRDSERLAKRFDALVKVLERDGVLQDGVRGQG